MIDLRKVDENWNKKDILTKIICLDFILKTYLDFENRFL